MDIFISREGQNHGPFEKAEIIAGLLEGTFSPEDLAWHEGAPDWQALAQISEEFAAVSAPCPPTPDVHPTVPAVAVSTKLRPPGAAGPPHAVAPGPAVGLDPALATLRPPDLAAQLQAAPSDSAPPKKQLAKVVLLKFFPVKFLAMISVIGVFASLFVPFFSAGKSPEIHRESLASYVKQAGEVKHQMGLKVPKFLTTILAISLFGLSLSAVFISINGLSNTFRPIYGTPVASLLLAGLGLFVLGFLWYFFTIYIAGIAEKSLEAARFLPLRMDVGFYLAAASLLLATGISTLPDECEPRDLPARFILPILLLGFGAYLVQLSLEKAEKARVDWLAIPNTIQTFFSK